VELKWTVSARDSIATIVARGSIHWLERWLAGSGAMLSPLHFHTGNAIHNHLRGEVKP